VGLSASPCLRARLKALEAAESSVVTVALVDGKAVGAGFVAYIEVRLGEAGRSLFKAASRRRCSDAPSDRCCFGSPGDFDYLLKVACGRLDEFHRFSPRC